MKKTLLISFVSLLGIIGCSRSDKDASVETFELTSKDVKTERAPDGRSKVFSYTLEKQGQQYVLKGKTTDMQAKEALLAKLAEKKITFTDSSTLLPATELGEKLYGVATQSVINFRTGAGYAAEAATQVMMGTPLQLLEKEGGWSRCITPEGYIAWVSSGSLHEMNKAEYDAYTAAPKVIVTAQYTTLTEAPQAGSQMVADAVWGNILLDLGKQGAMQKVALADGREAYLPAAQVEPFDKWLTSRNPTADNIIATAKQFIGIPYMWGGTSVKAVDCSGFTKTVYFLNGLILARDASQQCYTGEEVDIKEYTENGKHTLESLKNLQKGDLIFFGRKATAEKKERATHVGIYIGEGIFIHSSTRVRINSLLPEASNYYGNSNTLLRAQRMLGQQDTGKGIESITKSSYVPAR